MNYGQKSSDILPAGKPQETHEATLPYDLHISED